MCGVRVALDSCLVFSIGLAPSCPSGEKAGEAGEGEAETAKRDEEHHVPDGKDLPRNAVGIRRRRWVNATESVRIVV